MKTPKVPEDTPAQKAFETEQRRALNIETKEENRRRKALSRGQLGAVTLLSGLPADDEVVTGPTSGVGSTSGGVLDGSAKPAVVGTASGGNSNGGGRGGSRGGSRRTGANLK